MRIMTIVSLASSLVLAGCGTASSDEHLDDDGVDSAQPFDSAPDTDTAPDPDTAPDTDTALDSDTAVVPDAVVNLPPAAGDDSFDVTRSPDGQALDVLANDSDPEDGPLVIAAVGAPDQGGTVTTDGATLIYNAAPGFVGAESFTYTVEDMEGASTSATVTVTVVDPPPITRTFSAVNLPLTILGGTRAQAASVAATIPVSGTGRLADVEVTLTLEGPLNPADAADISLIAPNGDTMSLQEGNCGTSTLLGPYTFTDQPMPFANWRSPCPMSGVPKPPGEYRPHDQATFAQTFGGDSGDGTWTVTIDTVALNASPAYLVFAELRLSYIPQ